MPHGPGSSELVITELPLLVTHPFQGYPLPYHHPKLQHILHYQIRLPENRPLFPLVRDLSETGVPTR